MLLACEETESTLSPRAGSLWTEKRVAMTAA